MLGVGLAVAFVVAFVGALGSFVVFARTEVARRAISGVDVDWQVQLAAGARPSDALNALQPRPGARASEVVGYGDATAFQASSGGTVQTTGAGKVVGMSPSYRATFGAQIRDLVGAPKGVLLTQQTAANLHAAPGSDVAVQIRGRGLVHIRVDGIVDMPNADSFFQAVGARAGAGPQAPPDDVVIVPMPVWRQLYDPANGDGALQLHVRLARRLARDPSAAFAQLAGERKNYEVRMSGGATVGDNLAARLDGARKDATYGQLLFLFLGLPGVALGVAFAVIGAAAGAERRRAELALLRMRGASPTLLTSVALTEAALVWGVGAVVGTAVGWACAAGVWRVEITRFWPWAVAALALGAVATTAATVVPALRDARALSVAGARRAVRRDARRRVASAAAWAVAGLAAAVVWYSARPSYNVVVAPEGVPTISVSYLSLLGPALAWMAGAWLVAAGASFAFVQGRAVMRRLARPLAGNLSGLVAGWMARLRPVAVRAVLLLAVAVAFAVSSAVFDATFSAQSRVDAQLTNGADVSAFAPPGVDLQPYREQVARIRGVAAAEPMQHRFAYVGNDLQDLYGIHAGSIGRATTISDAYFGGGDARRRLAALNQTGDGVYVSDETVKDFVLRIGDTINLRLLNASTHAYVPVLFHVMGVVREFPTAPTDSFLVANAAYVARQTHSNAHETLLVRADRSQPAVAAAVRASIPAAAGARVRDIVEQRRVTATGLVALDLGGLSALNLAFGALGTLWAVALLLAVAYVERRRQFAILRALGAKGRHVAAFVGTESGSVVLLGAIAGLALGSSIAWILVRVLRGVFDPPPAHPIVPWVYLGVLAAAIAMGLAAAVAFELRHSARLRPEALRDFSM